MNDYILASYICRIISALFLIASAVLFLGADILIMAKANPYHIMVSGLIAGAVMMISFFANSQASKLLNHGIEIDNQVDNETTES